MKGLFGLFEFFEYHVKNVLHPTAMLLRSAT